MINKVKLDIAVGCVDKAGCLLGSTISHSLNVREANAVFMNITAKVLLQLGQYHHRRQLHKISSTARAGALR